MDQAEHDKLSALAGKGYSRHVLKIAERAEKSGLKDWDLWMAAQLVIARADYLTVIVSDFDDTLTPFTEPLARQLFKLFRWTRMTVLTGNKKSDVDRKALHTSAFRKTFRGRRAQHLKNLTLLPKTNSEQWDYDPAAREFIRSREMVLAEALGERNANGEILPEEQWNPDQGQQWVAQYKAVLEDVIIIFSLREGVVPGIYSTGELIEDRGSQINLQIMGVDASDADKDAYHQWEEKFFAEHGYKFRELIAAYINWRNGRIHFGNDKYLILIRLKP
ncbi:MAG: hypothetical protein EOM23_04380 [Candidatus Moranbacteria bacterium]|nr:hypothetical protein [Candidatus Moranbacteria bacterium]